VIKSKPLRTSNEAFGNKDLFALCERIITSGALGRSRNYRALLQYLVQCSIEGKSPKELEIAIDVLGRNNDFDVSVDSAVRVYVHQLRKKLDAYFEKYGVEENYRIVVPKGSYSLSVIPSIKQIENSSSLFNKQSQGNLNTGLLIAGLVLLIVNLAYMLSVN
jgi:hypothetical protein